MRKLDSREALLKKNGDKSDSKKSSYHCRGGGLQILRGETKRVGNNSRNNKTKKDTRDRKDLKTKKLVEKDKGRQEEKKRSVIGVLGMGVPNLKSKVFNRKRGEGSV